MNPQIIKYAISAHAKVNHLYDGSPYSLHLSMVAQAAMEFIHCIPDSARDTVLAACWCHDLIEDAHQTYNDVKKATNHDVAEITYACTNDKGKNRPERAGEAYYKGIRETRWAVFVKLCDRLANVRYSLSAGSRMYEVYKQENAHFLESLQVAGNISYTPIVDEIKLLLDPYYNAA